MATQAGIGVLIGLGIGSGITAFLMQRIIRRQDNALKQSITRLNHSQEDYAQELNAATAKMEADYEQQIARKIERYQDTHQEQLTELAAEYEARIAALTNIGLGDDEESVVAESAAAPIPQSPPQPNAFSSIPDPWTESSGGAASALSPEPEPTPISSPEPASAPASEPVSASSPELPEPAPVPQSAPAAAPVSPPSSSAAPPRQVALTQTATALGKAAAINRKDAIRAIPQLGKLIKDTDADVRLAAVSALQESGSIKAIPFLRQALRDTDNRIVAAASAALSRFKGAKPPATKAKIKPKKRRR